MHAKKAVRNYPIKFSMATSTRAMALMLWWFNAYQTEVSGSRVKETQEIVEPKTPSTRNPT